MAPYAYLTPAAGWLMFEAKTHRLAIASLVKELETIVDAHSLMVKEGDAYEWVTQDGPDLRPPAPLCQPRARQGAAVAEAIGGRTTWAPMRSVEESRARAREEDARRQAAAMLFNVANPAAPVQVSYREGDVGPVEGCSEHADWASFKDAHDWTRYPVKRVIGSKEVTVVFLKTTPWVRTAVNGGQEPLQREASREPRVPRGPKADLPPSGYIPNSRLAMAVRAAGFVCRGGVPMAFEREGDGARLTVGVPPDGNKSSSLWSVTLPGKAEASGTGHAALSKYLGEEDK